MGDTVGVEEIASSDTNEEMEISKEVKEDNGCYGELVLLGYNGSTESLRPNNHGRKNCSKMVFQRREHANGVKKGFSMAISAPPNTAPSVKDASKHVVSFSYNKGHTVLVEYVPDPTKDMFQIGRSSENQIDFTIVDTCLMAGSSSGAQSASLNSGSSRRFADKSNSAVRAHAQRIISSTISRYACRIFVDRDIPGKTYVYAAGFDASKNIFLGERAAKWQKRNGEFDGLTTNGILVLHPNRCDVCEDEKGENCKEMYVWREVSVDGDIYSLRETRSSSTRGELISDETNQLQDGSLIDLCGATLLWRSADGLRQSPSRAELERRLDELNAGKPQCPVNLNTLIIPRRKLHNSNASRQPYVYLGCGHVQGKHNWGVIQQDDNSGRSYRCPICMIESSKIIKLIMGMESAFHLNSESLDYAFNPCGHVASFSTVRYWSRIPLPHGTNSFYPVCPFCTTLLAPDKPYLRLIFQDHCS